MSSLQLMPGVFVLPPLLSAQQIADILKERESGLLSFCGPGAGDDDGHAYVPEPKKRPRKPPPPEDHSKPKKPHDLPKTAKFLWPHVADMIVNERPVAIDPLMKLYRLREGSGAVSPHRDEDFVGPSGLIARWSLLIYLNENFRGGETVFERSVCAPHLPTGGGLLFRHDVLHEGLIVQLGEKYVLKTDVFCH